MGITADRTLKSIFAAESTEIKTNPSCFHQRIRSSCLPMDHQNVSKLNGPLVPASGSDSTPIGFRTQMIWGELSHTGREKTDTLFIIVIIKVCFVVSATDSYFNRSSLYILSDVPGGLAD